MYFLNPPLKGFHESFGTKMLGFSWSFVVIAIHYAYFNSLNKDIDLFGMQILNCFDYFLVLIDVGEDVIMANDVVTPLNFPIVLVEEEELEKSSINMNVS